MVDDFVISGLVKRRTVLSGEIVQIQSQLKQKQRDLETLDAALLIFDADYPIDAIAPKTLHATSDWATRGELSRLIFSILRQAAEPLTARAVALEIMTYKQMDITNHKRVKSMVERIGYALRKKRKSGHLCCHKGSDSLMLWGIAKEIKPPTSANTPSTVC